MQAQSPDETISLHYSQVFRRIDIARSNWLPRGGTSLWSALEIMRRVIIYLAHAFAYKLHSPDKYEASELGLESADARTFGCGWWRLYLGREIEANRYIRCRFCADRGRDSVGKYQFQLFCVMCVGSNGYILIINVFVFLLAIMHSILPWCTSIWKFSDSLLLQTCSTGSKTCYNV